MTWTLQQFDELSPRDLYAILRLRSEVFVVEQNCVFPDMDNKDQQCYHLCGWLEDELAAYTRIVPPGVSYALPSIGRVVTSPAYRQKGIGQELMHRSIGQLTRLFGETAIQIGAQLYLRQFYERLGFVQSSNIYIEDGIDHIEMIRPAGNRKTTK